MKYLIAIDSDGTLRKSDGTITQKTKETIKKVIEKGSTIVICTGRPRYHTLKIAKEIGASQYLISSNGTEIFDSSNNKILYASYLPETICNSIFKDTLKIGIRVIFVCDNVEYVTKFTRNDSQILLDNNNFKEVKNVKQIMIIDSDYDKIAKYKTKVLNEYKLNVIDNSEKKEEPWFSIISNGSSKGNALKVLANYLNIPTRNTIAIGNDINDLSMIRIAGIGVAVSNAIEELKKEADVITNSNDLDGVANYLLQLMNENF